MKVDAGGTMIRTIVLLILSLFAAGCGSSDDDLITAAKPKVAPAKPAPLEDLWRWPEDAGHQRDVLADQKTCKDKAERDPAYQKAPPFGRFLLWGKCMGDLGWEFVQPQPG